jgi:hypothetical protein
MEYEIKILNSEDDFNQARDIVVSHEKILRHKVEIEKDVLFRNILNSNQHIFVGAFKNNQIDAFMTYRFFNQLPVFQLGNLYTRRRVFKFFKFSNSNNPIPKILDFILKDAEEKKYYTFYYSRANIEIYNKLIEMGEGIPQHSEFLYDRSKKQYRYNRYIEEIISPNSSSQYLLHTKMFLLGLWSSELIIYKYSLKNEYRNFQNISEFDSYDSKLT